MTASSSPSVQVLSAFTEEDSSFLKSLASQSMGPTGRDVGFLTSPKSSVEVTAGIVPDVDPLQAARANSLEEAFRTAALLGAFDPKYLIPDVDEWALKRLLDECTVSTDGVRSRWSLRASARERLLAQMASETDGLAKGVDAARRYLAQSGEAVDEVTQTLLGIASAKPPLQQDFAAMSKEGLAASRAAIGWLQAIDRTLGFDASGLLAAIELAELLEPFRFLTGFDPKTGEDTFVGRLDELRQLRAFVDVLRSESLVEAVTRSGRRLVGSERRVLGFSGVGGVGKSTLLAKFILQHVGPDSPTPIRFAYLDFDRATITAVQPVTLLLEMARQVGWQVPGVQRDLEELRSRIREEMERNRTVGVGSRSARGSRPLGPNPKPETTGPSEPDLPEELIGPSLLNSYLNEVRQILSRGQTGREPLLLVLDTFEEAQVLGDEAVRRVEGFVESSLEQLPNMRVVLVGRDAVDGFFDGAERLVVVEFKDLPSRMAFLEKRGLDKSLSKAVAQQVGGRPLALLLAARLVKEQGLDSITVSLKERFRGFFNKYLIDGILYERILGHIDDDDVKALAHPGLVLRRIDSEILRQVVAPVLGLGEISAERATKILSALRLQKDLVRSEPDGSVTHRADVRGQMLALMSLEKPELVQALHSGAAQFYAARQLRASEVDERDRDRVEEIYHRLSTGDALDRMPELWFYKARLGLARSVEEIENVAGRGTLKVLLGRVPTPEEVRALPDSVLRDYTSRALRSAIELPDPDRALSVLAEFQRHVDPTLRRSVEPRALDLSGQWTSARRLYVELVDKQGIELPLAEALAAADFFERMPGRERYREVVYSLVRDIQGRQTWLDDGPKMSMSPQVSTLRLRVRQGQYGKGRPSIQEAELGSELSAKVAFSSLNVDSQWLLTLTNEIELNGFKLMESIPVTDTVRGQLTYLQALLRGNSPRSEDSVIAMKICDLLAHSRTLGVAARRDFSGSAERDVIARVFRHLVRPSTPQWYVPIACLIRREFGEVVRSADLYDEALPALPFRAGTTLRSVRSLADYLGRLDQLGVLHTCLLRLVPRMSEPDGSRSGLSFGAYFEWREAMLFDIDDWFSSFDRVRILSVRSRAS